MKAKVLVLLILITALVGFGYTHFKKASHNSNKISDNSNSENSDLNQELKKKEEELAALASQLEAATTDRKNLKNQIDQLKAKSTQQKNELSNLQSEAEIETLESNDDVKKKAPSPLAQFMNADFLKTMIPMQVNPIISELTAALNLSAVQAEELKKLLTKKSEAGLDIAAPFFDLLKEHGSIEFMTQGMTQENTDNPELEKKIKNLQEIIKVDGLKIQKEFEDSITQLLEADQIKKYQQFETDKKNQQIQMAVQMQVNQFQTAIPDLDDYQKEQINQIYNEAFSDDSEAKLGSAGSGLGQGFDFGDKSKKLIESKEKIYDLLSTEQIKKHEEHQKKQQEMIKNMMGLIGKSE